MVTDNGIVWQQKDYYEYQKKADERTCGMFSGKESNQALGYEAIFFDGAAGTARELKRQLEQGGILADSGSEGMLVFENSDPSGEHLRLGRELFEQ